MTLNLSASPHVRDRWTTSFIMHTVLLSLVPAAAVGVIVYGWHALLVILASILAAVGTEALFCLITKRPLTQTFKQTKAEILAKKRAAQAAQGGGK